jgi:hypothetical protein
VKVVLVVWAGRARPGIEVLIGATSIAAAKLAACVVVRFTYGVNYVGAYVAGDWRTAKLMISLFWMFTMALSLGLLVLAM